MPGSSILIKSINQIILFPVCLKLYLTANIGKVVSSKHTGTIGFLFVASKRTVFLSLVKLPSVIKIHSETTRPHSTLKIQVRPGVLTGCPLVYNGSTFLRLCDHSPRGVPFSFFLFFFSLSSNPLGVIRWFVIIVCFLPEEHDASCTGVSFRSNASRTRLDIFYTALDAEWPNLNSLGINEYSFYRCEECTKRKTIDWHLVRRDQDVEETEWF